MRAGERALQTPSQPADSALTAYYKLCKAHRADAEAPAMCDTLFRRAEAARNVRMQAIALCVRLDHFYYKNDRAEILEGVRRVQEFCRRHPKEDLRYFYYFVWSSRLITYYIKQNQSNTAIYETRMMLAEAEDDGEPFEEKMQRLTGEIAKCFEESNRLQEQIKKNLEAIGYGM